MSTQRMAGMTMLLLILTVCVAHAEDGLTGTYRATGTKGEIVLTLQQNEQGGASGTLRGGELSLQLNGLPRADGGIIGRATTQTGEFASYFAVVRQDGQLLFMLIPANANGDPDLERASQFPFPIGDNAPAAAPLAGAPLAGAAGDFSGSFSGDGLKFESRAQGNGYSGIITVGEQKMPFTATVANGVLRGEFTAGNDRFEFQARWQGTTLLLTSGETNYKLRKQGGTNPLAKPQTPRNPLEKSQAPPATSGAPAGAPTGGAAWKVFKHPIGLSLRYPPQWKAQDLGDSLQLLPPDVRQSGGAPSEIFLMLADNAGPIQSGDDPRLEHYMEQQAMQYLPGFTRAGATQAITVGTAPGILMTWEGTAQGKPARAQIYATVLRQFGVALLAVSHKDQIKASRDAEVKQIFTSLAAGAGEKDPQLVGKWFLYSYKSNSSSNSHYYGRESKSYLTLLPDGSALWGQQSESAFSSSAGGISGRDSNADRGTWSAGKGQLIVFWNDGTTGSWQYRVGGAPGNRRLFLTQNGKTDEWTELR